MSGKVEVEEMKTSLRTTLHELNMEGARIRPHQGTQRKNSMSKLNYSKRLEKVHQTLRLRFRHGGPSLLGRMASSPSNGSDFMNGLCPDDSASLLFKSATPEVSVEIGLALYNIARRPSCGYIPRSLQPIELATWRTLQISWSWRFALLSRLADSLLRVTL